jgi:hypothetical protein
MVTLAYACYSSLHYLMGLWHARDSFAWGNKPVPPASNASGSSLLLSLENDEGSGPLANINVRPASRGSSGSSTSGSDLLDSPLFWGRNSDQVSALNVSTLHNSATATSRPQRTDSRSEGVQLSHFRTSFSEALKAPLRSTAKRVCTHVYKFSWYRTVKSDKSFC